MATPALAAMSNLFTAATRLAQHSHLFELVPARPFAPADLDQLDAHIGPYDRVTQSGFVYGCGDPSAWASPCRSDSPLSTGRPGDLKTGDVQWVSVDSSARRGTRPMSTISCALYQTYLGPH